MTTTGLTDGEMRVRIAEACGWKIPDHCITKRRMAGMTERQCKGAVSDFGQDKAGVYHDSLPDYLNDLNAMHAAEKTLSNDQMLEYITALAGMMGLGWYQSHKLFHATARQRALAFLAILPEPEAGR